MSTFSVDCEYKPHVPLHMKNDKAAIWLYRNLENHSLSLKLSWLISDKSHILACYNSTAYLCQQNYAESTLICLRAVERNQPSLMSEINPSLFLNNQNVRDYYRIHRRCSSFPDSHLKNLSHCIKNRTPSNKPTTEHKNSRKKSNIQGKLKAWHSAPNLLTENLELKKNMEKSHTNPSTPININTKKLNRNSLELNEDIIRKIKCKEKNIKSCRQVKHVIINNQDIIEHTPSLTNSDSHLLCNRDSPKSLIKSLPLTSSPRSKYMGTQSPPEYNFLSTLSGQKDYKKVPKKSFIEDGGMSVLPMSTG